MRKSKAEKKALRAQRAIEQKKAWRQRHKEAQHVAVAARATAREERMASMDWMTGVENLQCHPHGSNAVR